MHVKQTLLALLVAGGTGALLAITPAHAQQPQAAMTETKSAKGRGAGADENIKLQRAANKPGAETPAPTSKGGDKTRGTTSIVHVDNHTNWYIDAYMDGSFCATVGPWGDVWCNVGTGNTRMYAKADFTDNSSLTWGPNIGYVDGTYTWRLWP